jgi:hypothetical protein
VPSSKLTGLTEAARVDGDDWLYAAVDTGGGNFASRKVRARNLVGLLATSDSDLTVVNTTSLSDLFRVTLPTDLAAGDRVIAEVMGTLTNNSGVSETPTFTVGIGTTTTVATPGAAYVTSAQARAMQMRLIIAVESPTAQRISATLSVGNPNAAAVWSTVVTTSLFAKVFTATENLAVAKDIFFQVQFTAASASMSATTKAYTVQKVAAL